MLACVRNRSVGTRATGVDFCSVGQAFCTVVCVCLVGAAKKLIAASANACVDVWRSIALSIVTFALFRFRFDSNVLCSFVR